MHLNEEKKKTKKRDRVSEKINRTCLLKHSKKTDNKTYISL